MRHVAGEVSVVLIAARNKCPAFPNRSFGDLAAWQGRWLVTDGDDAATAPLSSLVADILS